MTGAEGTAQTIVGRVAAFTVRHLAPEPVPVARPALALAVARAQIPPALAVLYEHSDGLMLDAFDVFALDEALGHPAQPALQAAFPGAALFGWDRSGYLFFIDTENTMHRGREAVFAVDKLYLTPATCILCADTFVDFLEATEQGSPPWMRRRLIDEQSMALRAALADADGRIETRPGRAPEDISAVAKARGMSPGAGHIALLQITDGLFFAETGFEVLGLDDLAAVTVGDRTEAGLCHFARATTGQRFAVWGPGGARPDDLVLMLDDRVPLASAPALGRVLDVVLHWVTGKAVA